MYVPHNKIIQKSAVEPFHIYLTYTTLLLLLYVIKTAQKILSNTTTFANMYSTVSFIFKKKIE